MGRSRGGLSTKIHALVDAAGRPLRLCEPFEARRNVHAVPEQVLAFDHDIAEMDPNAEPKSPILGDAGVRFVQGELDLDRASDCLDSTCKLSDDAVACGMKDAAVLLRDQAVNNGSVGLESGKRALLVLAHEPGVPNHIGGENGRKSALYPFLGQARPPGYVQLACYAIR